MQTMERTGWNVIIFLTRHYSALSAVNVDFTACYVLHQKESLLRLWEFHQCNWFYCCNFVEIQVPPQLDHQKNTLHALMWKLTVLVKVGLKSNKIMRRRH